GVRSVQATPLTGNVLIRFDPAATNAQALLTALRTLEPALHETGDGAAEPDRDLSTSTARGQAPRVLQDRHGPNRRVRLAVRGLERDPHLARRIVDRLERHPGVRVRANPLTGRVLVEIANAEVALDDLLADVADLEAPALPGEDRPAHPLDPAPLLQSASRTVGAALGLGLLAARQLAGLEASSVAPAGPATAAGIIGILQGFPLTRNGLRVLLGRHVADLLFSGAAIVSLTLAGSPLGLAVTCLEALRLLTEVVARRAAWRRYEERLEGVASAEPGALIRVEAGERIPRAASVIEGTGSVR